MRRLILIAMLLGLGALTIQAQRIGCIPTEQRAITRSADSELPSPMDFDPQKIYRVPVVLYSFSDTDFSMDDPKTYYHRMLNEQGFNKGAGPGCLADYFREQSGGRLNLQFDVYGPFKVDNTAGGHTANKYYFGYENVESATEQLCQTETTDFSKYYDWNGDGRVEQVLFLAAGFSGNQVKGYSWPSTTHESLRLPGGIYSDLASITCELWSDGSLWGFGVMAHEFCHCLGLPDIYPLKPATILSVADEWDLMDGGNYTNKGWCPPNLTAMERMYLGWDQPVELKEPTTVTGMKPLSAGGTTYIIRNSGHENEYYLLENRRQDGWDSGCPGNGLLIAHVIFRQYSWENNQVNISDSFFRYDVVHADGKFYIDWDPTNEGKDPGKYTMDDCMRSRYFSTTTYPYTNLDTQVLNDMLTDTSSPAAVLYYDNAEGSMVMGKPITNIRLADDGTISFDFMGGTTGIENLAPDLSPEAGVWYDLQGRRLKGKPTRKGIYVHDFNKVVVK